jgi:glyoxylase-like metal-dependent hydrolase (beta-lactamase superfamily II)
MAIMWVGCIIFTNRKSSFQGWIIQIRWCNYPSWLSPTFAHFDGMSVPGFGKVMPLTSDGRLFIVPKPGHTAGHQSVVLVDNNISYLFAGDTSFTEVQMKAVGTAAIAANPNQMRQTLSNIQQYAKSNPTVYLPSHDHETRLHLQNNLTVQV